MEQRKCENTDDTKQNKRREEIWRGVFRLNITNKEKKKRQRGRNAADRGPHEAEQEKTKFLGPQFCRSGIGILRKGEVIP
ncbi:hypothetical protein T01_5609 [Trichinella spiralis]|uniref:Uncharacterized protein n=1 Tax=Trichinella spiralis TaxID=6334 RepID=A0A0V1AVY5_TRISP|nr:hypothetical protein T01_5609 [Trichinella spiralis]